MLAIHSVVHTAHFFLRYFSRKRAQHRAHLRMFVEYRAADQGHRSSRGAIILPTSTWKCTCARRATGASPFHAPDAPYPYLREETIWTESSHKYRAQDVSGMAARNGYRRDSQWLDSE